MTDKERDAEFARINCIELRNYFLLEECEYDGSTPWNEYYVQHKAWRCLLRYLEPDREWNGTEAWDYFKQRWGESNLKRALTEYRMIQMPSCINEPFEGFRSSREMYFVAEREIAPRVMFRQFLPAREHAMCLNGDKIWAVRLGEQLDHGIFQSFQWNDVERGIHPMSFNKQTRHMHLHGMGSFHCPLAGWDTHYTHLERENRLIELPSLYRPLLYHHLPLPNVLVDMVCTYTAWTVPRYELEKNAPRLRKRKRIRYGK